MESIERLVSTATADASVFMEDIKARSMESSLDTLFNQMDKNGDGMLTRDEFLNMSLVSWAALQALTSCYSCIPQLPSVKNAFGQLYNTTAALSSMNTTVAYSQAEQQLVRMYEKAEREVASMSYFDMFCWYLFLNIGFQVFLFMVEQWRSMLGTFLMINYFT